MFKKIMCLLFLISTPYILAMELNFEEDQFEDQLEEAQFEDDQDKEDLDEEQELSENSSLKRCVVECLGQVDVPSGIRFVNGNTEYVNPVTKGIVRLVDDPIEKETFWGSRVPVKHAVICTPEGEPVGNGTPFAKNIGCIRFNPITGHIIVLRTASGEYHKDYYSMDIYDAAGGNKHEIKSVFSNLYFQPNSGNIVIRSDSAVFIYSPSGVYIESFGCGLQGKVYFPFEGRIVVTNYSGRGVCDAKIYNQDGNHGRFCSYSFAQNALMVAFNPINRTMITLCHAPVAYGGERHLIVTLHDENGYPLKVLSKQEYGLLGNAEIPNDGCDGVLGREDDHSRIVVNSNNGHFVVNNIEIDGNATLYDRNGK